MPISRTASAMQNGIDEVKQRARVAVGGQRDGHARVEQPPRVRVGRAGGELDAGQQGGDGVAAGQRVDVGVGQVGAVVDAGRAQLDGQRARPGPAASWLPCTRSPSPAARPGVSTARASSPSKACGLAGSQNTSTQRACGAQAASIGPVTRSTYSAPVGARRARRARRGTSSPAVTSAASAQAARLVGDGEPVAALDLDGRGALRAHLGDQRGQPGAQLRRRSRRGWPRPSRRSRRRRSARRSSGPRTRAARSPANTRWAWLSTNPGTTARPPTSTRRSASGASDAGPTQATTPSVDDQRGVADHAQRPGAEGRVVGDQLARCR